MALSLVFNPFTGKFDYIDKVDTSQFAPATPYYIAPTDTVTIATDKQMLFSQPCQVDGTLVLNGIAVLL